MTVKTIIEPQHTTGDTDSFSELHAYCDCSPDVGLCGSKLTDADTTADYADEPLTCVVCLDLEYEDCPRCGE